MLKKTNARSTSDRHICSIVGQLPTLPPMIRYYDEFDEKQRTIRDPTTAPVFTVYVDGRVINVRFDHLSDQLAILMKHVFQNILEQGLAPSTAVKYVLGSKAIGDSALSELLTLVPVEVGAFWSIFFSRALPTDAYSCAKSILHLLCKHRIGEWSETYQDVISALPLPFKDKYAVVRSGRAFISAHDEALIVRFLDDAAQESIKGQLTFEDARKAMMLLCAYQFGMRPVQIALLSLRDLKIRHGSTDCFASAYITFRMVKQRTSSAYKPLVRRVKSEWTPLVVQIDRQLRADGADGGGRLFGVQSALEASRHISTLLRTRLELDATAVNLRHTAAQRLVDAGASHDELAEFLGHSDTTTALVYYETSANQAERVNSALGISEIYQRIARIAHDRFISADELALLKDSQQIGGAPHGVAIAGIGGCTSGQPACPYNPILSCYGCMKFMPIQNLPMHLKVLSDLREVARFFHESSRGDFVSPVYLQLERTIAEVQAVVFELEGLPS
ncbi:tyrosine-type recombinase/integrase [Stenotrophomonas sp.]|uniref:tyrosine-type recombinase/integrase n=1 Tax=Stenotrophomonas sp. TaxID=69392 RepID=UPI0025E1E822|nr:tyrosine-type recombinase/integrase [Stenotrophomonas sp.]